MTKPSKILTYVFVWLGVLVLAIWIVFPVFWAIGISFKSGAELYAWPPIYIPRMPTWENYQGALARNEVVPAIRNSLLVTFVSTPFTVIISAAAAFALSRFTFRGREAIKYSVLAIRMIPGMLIAIPLFLMVRWLGMQDKVTTLILAYTAFNIPFNIWMLSGFFEEIPREIEESAVIDGCTSWQVFVRVLIPLSAPALVAATIFSMLLAWNEFQFAVVLTFTKASKTLPVIIAAFYTDRGVQFGQMAATGTIAILPLLAFGIWVQRYLVAGLTAGAVKG